MSAPQRSTAQELAMAAGVALVGIGVVAGVLGLVWLIAG